MSKRFVGIGLAALLAGAGFSAVQGLQHAAAAPTTRAARLIKPWNELKDLSEDQIAKIKAIHEKALEETHKIEAKEKADCMEILTEAQKKELETVLVQDKKEAAERRIEREHAATEPTTKPSK
jgi:Spy/CpxP family protein refolding chaperone